MKPSKNTNTAVINTPREVNNKKVDAQSDLVTVHLIDWTKFNKETSEQIKKEYEKYKDTDFEIRDYNGAIIHNDKLIIITDEACSLLEKDGKISLSIYEKSTDNSIAIFPTFDLKVPTEEIKLLFTGEQKLLPDFMNERYKYNGRIERNEHVLLNYLFKK